MSQDKVNGLIPPDPDSTDGVLKKAPETTNQNSLDTNQLEAIIADHNKAMRLDAASELVGGNRSAAITDVITVKALLAWHHQQATQEFLALVGEDEKQTDYERNPGMSPHPRSTLTYQYRKGRNELKAELRNAIQAREEQ